MLKGIQNFLQFINENWTTIIVIISLLLMIVQKTKSYFSKTKEERIEIAKQQIQQICLKLISDAELDYGDWKKAGSLKRTQVIEKIYSDYPILAKATDQEALTKWLDKTIDNSLTELREIIDKNDNKNT